MLLGNYSVNLSFGRRLAIPKQYRRELGTNIIIAKWYENCLVIVKKENWEELIARITGKTETLTTPIRDTERFVLGSAFELKADSQGRVVIPEPLAKYAKITKNTTFIGLGNRVEIWNTKDWQKKENQVAEDAAELLERIAKNE